MVAFLPHGGKGGLFFFCTTSNFLPLQCLQLMVVRGAPHFPGWREDFPDADCYPFFFFFGFYFLILNSPWFTPK